MSVARCVTAQAARRFQRRTLLLDQLAATVGEALARLGYVQIDPVNVCGRMHDLILRNRVAGYREDDLLRYLYGDPDGRPQDPPSRPHPRFAFEHYLPGAGVLAMLPLDAWPHLRARMLHRRSRPGGYAGRLSAAEESLARRILGEIAYRGPLGSNDIDHDSRAVTAWGTHGRMAKTVLDKLFFRGRVLICRRDGIRRVYDLPERVLPPEILHASEPSPDETARWLLRLRFRQRRLAPLDPLIYDRRVTRCLWGFDYTWEGYLPPARRKRGHYALPVLVGTELVGHVNPRADRAARRLRVVSRSVRRGYRVAPAVRQLAQFLGLRS